MRTNLRPLRGPRDTHALHFPQPDSKITVCSHKMDRIYLFLSVKAILLLLLIIIYILIVKVVPKLQSSCKIQGGYYGSVAFYFSSQKLDDFNF